MFPDFPGKIFGGNQESANSGPAGLVKGAGPAPGAARSNPQPKEKVAMKNKITVHALIIASLTALASVASAQPANAAAAARAAVPPVLPPPTVSAGAAASTAASAAAAARAPVLPPTASTTAAAASVNAGAKASPGLNSQASMHASAQGQANGLAVATVATDNTRATLRMDETVKTIHTAAFAEREKMTAEVQARLDASATLVAEMRARAEAGGEKSRAAFAKALVEMRKAEKQVRADLKAATKAAGESTWGSVQSELAKSYGDYAKTVAEAEVAAQGTTEVTTPPKG
jgi:hypothetical protein